jgi:uncharacterized membrane protein
MSTDQSNQKRIKGTRDFRFLILAGMGTVLLLAWLLNTPPGLLGKTDAVGYAVCHRISSHSFYFAERPFSLCARCTGQYLGFLWGFVYQLVIGKSRKGFPRKHALIILSVIVFAYLIDGVNSVLNLYPGLDHLSIYEPMNQLRLFTGLGMGLFIIAIIYPLAGQAVWKQYSLEPVMDENRHWIILSGGAMLLGLMILLNNPLLSYPMILASTAGLVLLLTVLYMVIWLLFTKRENSITSWKELVFWGVGGLITALAQIMAVDLIRFLLTGTWSGFLDY